MVPLRDRQRGLYTTVKCEFVISGQLIVSLPLKHMGSYEGRKVNRAMTSAFCPFFQVFTDFGATVSAQKSATKKYHKAPICLRKPVESHQSESELNMYLYQKNHPSQADFLCSTLLLGTCLGCIAMFDVTPGKEKTCPYLHMWFTLSIVRG